MKFNKKSVVVVIIIIIGIIAIVSHREGVPTIDEDQINTAFLIDYPSEFNYRQSVRAHEKTTS